MYAPRHNHAQQHAATRYRKNAVTLIELIIMLAIIGVLAGAIVPRMGRSQGGRELAEAAARFAHTARTVRELAVARAQTYAIEVDLDAGGYAAARPTAGGTDRWETMRGAWLQPQRWPANVTIAEFRTPDGRSPLGGTQRVRFFADGTSSGVSLVLARDEDVRKIIVHPHSGRVVHGDPRRTDFAKDQYDLGD